MGMFTQSLFSFKFMQLLVLQLVVAQIADELVHFNPDIISLSCSFDF